MKDTSVSEDDGNEARSAKEREEIGRRRAGESEEKRTKEKRGKYRRVSACEHRKSTVQRPRDQDDDGEFEGERRRKDEKWFREHVRRCSCGGRPVVPGINTAFNVGRRRSWTRSPQGASLLVAPGARLPRRASSRLSLPVIAPDPTPRPPPTEGSLLFLRSAIRR